MVLKDLQNEIKEMRLSMEKMTGELHDTNVILQDSLKMTTEAIKEMSDKFSKTMEDVLNRLSEITIQMNVRDTVLKNLGIDGMLPDIFKKKK